jgi:hypothetical protein
MMPWLVLAAWLAASVSCFTGRPNVRKLLEGAALGVQVADRACADLAISDWDLKRAERCAAAYSKARKALADAERQSDEPTVWCAARVAADHALDLLSETPGTEGRQAVLALHSAALEGCP